MNPFNEFINNLTKTIETNTEEESLVKEAERLMGQLIDDCSWLPEEACKTDQKHYARHSLYHDPKDRFEIIALAWLPGQKTPIHDHDGTWGVEGVVCGRMKVTNFLRISQPAEDIIQLRQCGTMTFGQHSTGQLLPPSDCHILEATGDQTVITIHVYGKQLRQFKIFEPIAGKKETYRVRDKYVQYTA